MKILPFDLDDNGRPVLTLYMAPVASWLEAMRSAGVASPQPVPVRALVDTGASGSLVQTFNLALLELSPTGSTAILTAKSDSSPEPALLYSVQLFFAGVSGGLLSPNIQVAEVLNLSHLGVDMLLGRDILDQCLLIYSGPEGHFTLAFGTEKE